ncbi:MAG: hypothetical protein AAF515_23340 [Pseudomonadota bacterium]
MDLVAKILQLHAALADGDVPHAFGGALALAWCTGAARATIDIDVNLFVGASSIESALAALPAEIECDDADRATLRRELQHRLWWGHTPVDLFFNSTPYHAAVARRVRWEDFAGGRLPFLSCLDLAVFKTFFDRTKDWADLEEMQAAGTLDVARVSGVIATYLGIDDPRLARLQSLATRPRD